MKRYIVEVDDDVTEGDIKEYLYWGAREKKVWKSEPVEVRETWEQADGMPRMTTKQRDKLWAACGNYGVPFREDDYRIQTEETFGTPSGWIEGWIGGISCSPGGGSYRKTIYVGVEPNGDSHS